MAHLSLTVGQKRKLRKAYRYRRAAVIGLSNDQLHGGRDSVILNPEQQRAVARAVKNKTGVRLVMDLGQLEQNVNGGLLKEIMEFVETNVPLTKKYVTPVIRNSVAPMIKEKFVPWLKDLIDNELDSIITSDPTGSGLKQRINSKLDTLLGSALKKGKLM